MSLRVLDDDRPGFALLLFSARLDQPTLSLSIWSVRESAYLGHDGKWQRLPHYFTADRIGDGARGTEYRVGPDIVNYLLEHDQITVATEDGALKEETLWENAVPQLPGMAGGHSIYRPGAITATETKPVIKASHAAEAEPPAVPSTPAAPPVLTPPPPPPPPPRAEAAPKPVPELKPGTEPVPSPRPAWQKFLPLAAIPVVLVALMAIPQVRCKLFGVSCPVKDLLTPAMVCAAERQGQKPCDVKACFDDYLADTLPRNVAPQATAVIDRSDQACRKEAQDRAAQAAEADELRRARQCVASVDACSAARCYDSYMARHGSTGIHSDEVRRSVDALKAACTPAPRPATPRPVADDRLRIPNDLDDLNGCWQSVNGDMMFYSGGEDRKPVGKVRGCYCFEGNGRGVTKYLYQDGTRCVGPLRAQLTRDQLFMSHAPVQCAGSTRSVVAVDILCGTQSGETSASCDIEWHFRSPTTTKGERFRRVSEDYCN